MREQSPRHAVTFVTSGALIPICRYLRPGAAFGSPRSPPSSGRPFWPRRTPLVPPRRRLRPPSRPATTAFAMPASASGLTPRLLTPRLTPRLTPTPSKATLDKQIDAASNQLEIVIEQFDAIQDSLRETKAREAAGLKRLAPMQASRRRGADQRSARSPPTRTRRHRCRVSRCWSMHRPRKPRPIDCCCSIESPSPGRTTSTR